MKTKKFQELEERYITSYDALKGELKRVYPVGSGLILTFTDGRFAYFRVPSGEFGLHTEDLPDFYDLWDTGLITDEEWTEQEVLEEKERKKCELARARAVIKLHEEGNYED